jgi:hypothetical protein
MFQLYIDEDSMDRDLVRALRARGVDVTTAQDVGMMGCCDEEHLLFATNQDAFLTASTVVTSSDFIRNMLQRANPTRASCWRATNITR